VGEHDTKLIFPPKFKVKRKGEIKKGETTLKQEKVHAFEAHAWSLCARMEFDLQVGANPIKSQTKP
jgi:hypothetical protein